MIYLSAKQEPATEDLRTECVLRTAWCLAHLALALPQSTNIHRTHRRTAQYSRDIQPHATCAACRFMQYNALAEAYFSRVNADADFRAGELAGAGGDGGDGGDGSIFRQRKGAGASAAAAGPVAPPARPLAHYVDSFDFTEPHCFAADGLHLSEFGYSLWNQRVAAAREQLPHL